MAGRNYAYIDFATEPIAAQIGADATVAAAGDNENTLHVFRAATLESGSTPSPSR